jgi:hypothetical protein
MAIKSSTREKWLVAALALVTLGLAGFMLRSPIIDRLEGRRICEQLRAGEADEQFFIFTHTTKGPFGPRLSPGKYRLTVTSDCYSGECSFVVPDVPKPSVNHPQYSGLECRGKQLELMTRGFYMDGFQAPGVLHPRRILVDIQREGRPFWHGTPGSYCAHPGFCVEARE